MARPTAPSLILGLDLGVSSIGWALLDREQQAFVAAGVRIFDSAMDARKFEKGEPGASNNVQRRAARLRRRQLRRKAARKRELFCCLQQAGLLPAEPSGGTPENRDRILTELDRRLAARWRERIRKENPEVAAPEHVLPYFLRARALQQALEPHELGRALYHLGQRRGFKSNRREGRKAGRAEKSEEERGKVLAEIAGLKEAIGGQTLGEYLCRQDPAQPRSIRRRWTAREMFEEEFEAIWKAQAAFHPGRLTAALKEKVRTLLFHQRPMQAGKPGRCELEPGCPRAPMATLAAQRFRMLQKVNDLAILDGEGGRTGLTGEQRRLLIDRLEAEGDLTFHEIRKLLGLPRTARFNLEAGRDKSLPGNRTAAVMRRAFGERWLALPEAEQRRIVHRWMEAENPEDLARMAMHEWGIPEERARALAATEAEEGYSRLSLKAMSKLLPLMEVGKAFKEAEREIYGSRFSGGEAKDRLGPAEDVLPLIPNPAVLRALTELRKVVNAIVREYGKPWQVRVELARDLKRSAKDRQALQEGMLRNRRLRAAAARRILQETGNANPSRDDETKVLLFDELQACAYCGRSFSFGDLFNGQAEVEHILPLSRFPDGSLANKTLACVECNREKAGRTPYEAFGSDASRWEQIQARVRCMKSGDKRKRFLLERPEDLEEFSARHLADTRYVSKLAARYLEQLYGGRDEEVPWEDQNRRAVYASSGAVTATLRRAWGLEAILREAGPSSNGHNPGKPRGDHRHHAVDAMVVALTSQAAIQQLSAAAAGRERLSGRTLQAPWPDFVNSVRPLIEDLKVSHRPARTLRGELHDETNYSPEKSWKGKKVWHVRKPVHSLTQKMVRDIVDARVREAVERKLEELGGPENIKKLEHEPPVLVTRKGQATPIRRVRIRTGTRAQAIGEGPRVRHVVPGGNHHIALFETVGRRGKEKGKPVWDSPGVVSRLEALRRHRAKEPIVQRALPPGEQGRFLFSLMGGDMVEMKHPDRPERELFVVRTVSEAASGAVELVFVRHTDARRVEDIKKTGDWIRITRLNDLRDLGCRKVVVDPLGNVRSAHD
ncbi:MAG TPA: type II CRISPR RNA-guided endonuclease Cas9 [Bryobacteraceae bacterium]|nr:type II CRISPR RNA-guided endonuclease Cas9 [Bryobacteraceae bacterium]